MTSFKKTNFIALSLIFLALSITIEVQSKEISTNSSSEAKSRMKRYLIFQPGSRILVLTFSCKIESSFNLFLNQFRVNVKDNIIKNNQIFAHGFGFRANIDLLQPMRPKSKIRKREVYNTLEELMNQQGETICLLSSQSLI